MRPVPARRKTGRVAARQAGPYELNYPDCMHPPHEVNLHVRPRPCGREACVVAFVFAATVASGCSEFGPEDMPPIDSTTVFSDDVVPRIDPARTYEYEFSSVAADSLLTALWEAGFRVDEAWRAVDYLCADIRGPRFVVALTRPSTRMADYDFKLGNGGLGCAVHLRQYVFERPAGSFYVTGSVRSLDVEGGCSAIRVKEDLQYEPIGLPLALREDGIDVRALLTLRDDLGSICRVGRIAEVLDIERR